MLQEISEQERRAVAIYAETGNYAETARRMGITTSQLITLRAKDWWDIEVAALRKLRNDEVDARVTNILEKALIEIDDRLQNGEEIAFGTGITMTKKVGALHLAKIAQTLFDVRQVVREQPTTEGGATKRLLSLAEKLESFARFQQARTIDALEDSVRETIDAGKQAGTAQDVEASGG